jgi:UDP-N-acetylmuramyl tripeptide synthase
LAQVIVDYAHTPDALRNALVALRQHTSKRLICVFGAGGERDIGKRKIMGQVADELADLCLITDDNPRNENPKRIRDQILEGCPNGESIACRGEAIKLGISKLQSGDLLLVAGKGHESTQEMNGQKLKFSDVEVVKDLMKNAEGFNYE